MEIDDGITHRPGRNMTLSAPESVSLMAMVGGGGRIVEAHDSEVTAAPGWTEKNAVETRTRDPAIEAMVRAGDQKTVVATFRHDTSRNLEPQLHTHAVVANMAIGAIYRAELAQGLKGLGHGIDMTPDPYFARPVGAMGRTAGPMAQAAHPSGRDRP